MHLHHCSSNRVSDEHSIDVVYGVIEVKDFIPHLSSSPDQAWVASLETQMFSARV